VTTAIIDFWRDAGAIDDRQTTVARARHDVEQLKNAFLNILVVVGILGLSALITHFFARAMYVRCAACATLNARRRTQCRNCGTSLQ